METWAALGLKRTISLQDGFETLIWTFWNNTVICWNNYLCSLYFFHTVYFIVHSKVMIFFILIFKLYLQMRNAQLWSFKHWIKKYNYLAKKPSFSSISSDFATMQINFLQHELLLARKKKSILRWLRCCLKNCCLLIFSPVNNPCSRGCYKGQQKNITPLKCQIMCTYDRSLEAFATFTFIKLVT